VPGQADVSGNVVTANVPGSFTCPSPAGTVLGAGSQTLPVTFTATADHAAGTASVGLTVRQAGTTTAVSSSLKPSASNRSLTLSGRQTVEGPVSLSQSTLTLSTPSIVAGSALTVTLAARDALGHQELGGRLTVAFSQGTGSAGGTFSAVTDRGNGTYTATFTRTKAGYDTILAAIGIPPVTPLWHTLTATAV
jgi:adhesin/invasin